MGVYRIGGFEEFLELLNDERVRPYFPLGSWRSEMLVLLSLTSECLRTEIMVLLSATPECLKTDKS